MKICSNCKLEKPESEFFFKNKSKNLLHSTCKECKREIDRKAYKENRNDRAQKIRINSIKQAKEAREFVRTIKESSKCKICGDCRWYVLDFHHIRNSFLFISNMVQNGSSIQRIRKEIDKCEILCANCHREVHYRLNNEELVL